MHESFWHDDNNKEIDIMNEMNEVTEDETEERTARWSQHRSGILTATGLGVVLAIGVLIGIFVTGGSTTHASLANSAAAKRGVTASSKATAGNSSGSKTVTLPPAQKGQPSVVLSTPNGSPVGPEMSKAQVSAFIKLASNSTNITYKAVYQITSGGKTYSMTVVQSPPESKLEFQVSPTLKMVGIDKGNGQVYNCFVHTGSAAAQPQPTNVPVGICEPGKAPSNGSMAPAASTVSSVASKIESAMGKYPGAKGLVESTTKVVAGIKLSCMVLAGQMYFCITPQGVEGYMAGVTTKGGGTMELTSYSSTVSASEFVLPGKVVSSSSLGGIQNFGSSNGFSGGLPGASTGTSGG